MRFSEVCPRVLPFKPTLVESGEHRRLLRSRSPAAFKHVNQFMHDYPPSTKARYLIHGMPGQQRLYALVLIYQETNDISFEAVSKDLVEREYKRLYATKIDARFPMAVMFNAGRVMEELAMLPHKQVEGDWLVVHGREGTAAMAEVLGTDDMRIVRGASCHEAFKQYARACSRDTARPPTGRQFFDYAVTEIVPVPGDSYDVWMKSIAVTPDLDPPTQEDFEESLFERFPNGGDAMIVRAFGKEYGLPVADIATVRAVIADCWVGNSGYDPEWGVDAIFFVEDKDKTPKSPCLILPRKQTTLRLSDSLEDKYPNGLLNPYRPEPIFVRAHMLLAKPTSHRGRSAIEHTGKRFIEEAANAL